MSHTPISSSSDISITNTDIDADLYGVHLSYAANILVDSCNIAGDDTGFQIENSYNVMIYDDTFSDMDVWIVFIGCQVKIDNSVFNDIDGDFDMLAMVSSSTVWSDDLYIGENEKDLETEFHWSGSGYMTFNDL